MNISAPFIWGSLINYSKMFGLGQDLQTALLIACSLRENRYLKKVGLPSGVDLIYPFLDGIVPWVQQMMMMTLVKDVGTSIKCTTTIQNDVRRKTTGLLSRNSMIPLKYIDDMTNLDVMKVTRPMIWLKYLDDHGIDLIMNTSVFEGFWLVKNPKKVLESGIISALKRGMKHPIRIMEVGFIIDHFALLLNEIQLGGGNT